VDQILSVCTGIGGLDLGNAVVPQQAELVFVDLWDQLQ